MAISSKDIETLWKRYSSEAVNQGVSVAQFFESNGVPYHVFEKWYKKKFTQQHFAHVMPDVGHARQWLYGKIFYVNAIEPDEGKNMLALADVLDWGLMM